MLIEPRKLYTLKHSGEAAGVSPSTVKNDANAGRVRAVLLSDGSRVIQGRELAKYVEARRAV